MRAHSTAAAGERLLAALGHGRLRRLPRPRLSLSPKLWLASFAATSLWYLLQSDAGAVSAGRWPLLAPWLHTYALPVFAVLSVLVAIAWGVVRDWLADVEDYAAATFARAFRLMRTAPAARTPQPADRRARAAAPLRARLRVAPASAPRLTPATLSPHGSPSFDRPSGGVEMDAESQLVVDLPVESTRVGARGRAHVIGLLGPLTVVAGVSGRSCSRTGSRCCTRAAKASGSCSCSRRSG